MEFLLAQFGTGVDKQYGVVPISAVVDGRKRKNGKKLVDTVCNIFWMSKTYNAIILKCGK